MSFVRCPLCTTLGCDQERCKTYYYVMNHVRPTDIHEMVVAKRDFIYLRFGFPQIIHAGETFRQNKYTKQVWGGNFSSDTTHQNNNCSICMKDHISSKCPNKESFWVSTQSTTDNYKKCTASRAFIIVYSGTILQINIGQVFYQNCQTKQVIVGWHGSLDPPCGMNDRSLLK